jgi:prepilin-type N-terminal cleavage/methylation domain-containing protein
MKKQKGFTLIEILIVVIILAILASMVLPRFLNQTESAYVAEAQQVLGVLRRAQANQADLGVTVAELAVADTKDNTKMAPLGLKGILDTNFSYECTEGGATCKATRKSGAASGGTVSLTLDGAFSCDGKKYVAVDSTNASKGCKVNS